MRYLLVLICLLVPPAAPVYADPPAGYPFGAFDAGLRAAAISGKPIFMYIGRHGCSSCIRTNQETFSDTALRQRLNEHYELVYVDSEGGRRVQLPSGERVTEMQLVNRLRTLGTPQFLFLRPDGEAILRAPGFHSIEEFLRFDDYVHGGHYRSRSLSEFLSDS